MSAAKRKKHTNQPELLIQAAKTPPAEAKLPKKTVATNGNGEHHLVAEKIEAILQAFRDDMRSLLAELEKRNR